MFEIAANALARTLREIGRLEPTLLTLDGISDPALRRHTTANLNKGEERNALARAVVFHRRAELCARGEVLVIVNVQLAPGASLGDSMLLK